MAIKTHRIVCFLLTIWVTLIVGYTIVATVPKWRHNDNFWPREVFSYLMMTFEAFVTVSFPIVFVRLYQTLNEALTVQQFKRVRCKISIYFFIMSFLMFARFTFYMIDKIKDCIIANRPTPLSSEAIISSYISELLFLCVIMFTIYAAAQVN